VQFKTEGRLKGEGLRNEKLEKKGQVNRDKFKKR